VTRRRWFFAAALLAGCAKPRAPKVEVFPETVAGVWHRRELRDVPVSDAPDPVPRSGVERLEVAKYEGPGKLEARAYQLSSKEMGLDVAQRWRPSADTIFFWAGYYFVVVKWQEADRKALQAFTTELEKRLNSPNNK